MDENFNQITAAAVTASSSSAPIYTIIDPSANRVFSNTTEERKKSK
jgi:hypothetical protein